MALKPCRMMVLRPSGNPEWDTAGLRAVQRSDPMPLEADGHVAPDFTIDLSSAS
jgi:colicin import membrane protein